MNPLYQSMNQNNLLNMSNEIKSNPAQFLAKMGVSIPNGMNNPNDIITYLMNTGKVSQGRYNQAVSMAQMLMNR